MTEVAFRVAKEWDVVTIRISDSGQKRVAQLLSQNRCLGCEEKHDEGQEVKCGQCPTCYQASRRAITAKRVSRNELIREGKMLAPRTGGKRPINKFTQELSQR